MPLHILLSTWIGTSFGVLEFMKVAKDMFLIAGFLAALTVSVRQPWFTKALKDRLVWLIITYGLLTLLLALVKPTEPDAEWLGVVYNTRFLLFFLYGVLLTRLFDAKRLLEVSTKIVLGVGVIVVIFGVVQYLILPDDALRHLGYSRENGVLPAFFIDDKPDLERVMSTVRDPNSLGSYLIVIGTLIPSAMFWLKKRKPSRTPPINAQLLIPGYYLLTVLCLWFTFSRSAWLGFVLAMVVLGVVSDNPFKHFVLRHKKKVMVAAAVTLVVGSLGLAGVRDSYFVQNVIFHADESTVLEDPNQLRTRFFQESVEIIVDNPEGSGPGTAGLASIRNQTQGTILNENYYLQIATEVGIIGLVLFLSIVGVVAYRLWHSQQMLAAALLASLVGLLFTNLLVHIWSNEAVAYTWWGLAGISIVSLNKRNNLKKS